MEVDEPRAKVERFLSAVYKVVSVRKTPYLIILEEADKFVPQVGERLQIIQEIARRGRKRGLGLLLCTQRPSLVDKNVLSQCSNKLIGRLVIKNDLQSVSQFFPEHGLPKQLTTLSPGAFYALGGLSPSPVSIQVRKRETTHGGITPRLRDRVVKPAPEFLTSLRVSKEGFCGVGLQPLIDSIRASTLAKKGKKVHLLRRRRRCGRRPNLYFGRWWSF
ncbi:MAG: ATP-binding protein [Nitrososphaeria archaeon]